jgi:hypothetical protein
MPGTTTNGFPYAVPTDPLVQWPATSQSLSERIDQGLAEVNQRVPFRFTGPMILTSNDQGLVEITQQTFAANTMIGVIAMGYGQEYGVYVSDVGDNTRITLGVTHPTTGALAPNVQVYCTVFGIDV